MKKDIDDFIASISQIPKAPWDEGVCKVCGIDRDDDSVLLCDKCDAEYHKYCLIPPLARIPEGNWYCPSCIGGKHSTQDVTERAQIPGKRRSKKFQGEINCLYLEALTHLSAVIEEKEYWEYSAGEVCWLKPIYVSLFFHLADAYKPFEYNGIMVVYFALDLCYVFLHTCHNVFLGNEIMLVYAFHSLSSE
jgi:hypothetical protein